MNRGAIFSNDRNYRYVLWRVWDDALPKVAWIGLNPSTADETKDDPTIRRCVGFARDWRYGGIYMLNLFAFRATSPKVMKAAVDPVGLENDWYIRDYAGFRSKRVIAAWGTHGDHRNRAQHFAGKCELALACLGLTKGGCPKHPLYLPAATRLIVYSEPKP